MMSDKDYIKMQSAIAPKRRKFSKDKCKQVLLKPVKTTNVIRRLVEKALYIRRLTPDLENQINQELTRLGYISDVEYEALELLMAEMDAGRIQLVPSA